MSHLRNVAKTGIVALALGTAVVTSAGSATADPTGFKTYSNVGSDTIQTVWDGLTAAKKPVIANTGTYEASPIGGCIQTSPGGNSYLRPTGSGAGAKAISAAYDPANHSYPDCSGTGSTTTLSPADIAFSRSSARPSTATPGSDLVYIPFARDAVSVAIDPAGANSPTNFTTSQLTAIYGGPSANTAGTGITYGSDGFPVLKGVKLTPLLPQSSSGTRSFFLSAIGNPALASYVTAVDANGNPILENDGSFVRAAGPGAVIPFSAAQWIGQNNKVQTTTTNGLNLTTINGLAPYTGTKKEAPGALFGASTKNVYTSPPSPGTGVFNRDTYDVVPATDFDADATASEQQLIEMLTGNALGDLGNKKSVAVIKKFGFGQLGYIDDQDQYLTSAFVH